MSPKEENMAAASAALPPGISLRRLAPQDLGAAAEIDARITGRSRRNYFERRLQAALREPSLHVQFAIDQDGALAGYMLGRKLEGEFGRPDPALRLEIIGVAPERQGKGLGKRLLARLEDQAKRLGIGEIRTQAAWRDVDLLRFLDHAGFHIGRNHVIDCPVHAGRIVAGGEPASAVEPVSREINYGAPFANDFETLARDRADVRSLTLEDVSGAARIHLRITGRDQSAYIARRVEEALRDSAIQVSLAAYRDGSVAGYITAKVDFGDFGRTEPVAVIDTIEVDPGFSGQGIGTALASQLFVNMKALQVERVETVVERERLDLLAFFHKMGFAPSERLGFVKRLKS